MSAPFLLMIAGPNGSGKTTLTHQLLRADVDLGEYINPDDIAAKLTGTYQERTKQAQKIADDLRNQNIKEGTSFTFETVMSHPSKLDVLVRAKEAGFQTKLFFIGTDDARTNIERVSLRVLQGGHDVPVEKIVTRWARTMQLLSEAIRSVDEAFIFDNSIAGIVDSGPRLVFRRRTINRRNIPLTEQFPPIPEWVRRFVLHPLAIDAPASEVRPLRSIIAAAFDTADKRPAVSATAQQATKVDEESPIPKQFSNALIDAVDTAARAFANPSNISGAATGLRDLDQLLGGLHHSELIVLASRPSIGKTSFAISVSYNLAKAWQGEVNGQKAVTTTGGIVGFFSLEMSAEQIATRVISQQTRIPADYIRSGRISDKDFEDIADAALELQSLQFYMDDTGGLTISQIASRARRLKEQRGLDLLVIDNIDLIRGDLGNTAANDQDLEQLTRQLKALSKELRICILALTQIPPHKKLTSAPRLPDLRRPLERDADVVILLHREDHYLLNEEPSPQSYEHAAWIRQVESVYGRAEMSIAKQRNGPTGHITLVFDSRTGRFSDLAP